MGEVAHSEDIVVAQCMQPSVQCGAAQPLARDEGASCRVTLLNVHRGEALQKQEREED